MNPNDPAFPVEWKDFQPHTGEQVTRSQDAGLTRREYFAIRFAVAAFENINTIYREDKTAPQQTWPESQDAACRFAVQMADKLCAELSRKEV